MVEGLSRLGLREVHLEAAEFAGARAPLDLPLDPEVRGPRAHGVAEEIMGGLSRELGAKSYLFVGELEVKALALANEDQIQESQRFFWDRGFNISVTPVE